MRTTAFLVSFDYKNNCIILRDYTMLRNHGTIRVIDSSTNDAASLLTFLNTHPVKHINDGIICGYVIDKPVWVFNVNARLRLGLDVI